MKLTPKHIEALVSLRGNPHFTAIMEGMAEHEKEETEYCTAREGTQLHRSQGAVGALRFWRESFQNAPAFLTKIQQQHR